MKYQNLNNEISSFSFQKQNLFCMLGLYFFSLGSSILGYSAYLFLESFGLVQQKIISWNGQGLFWFLILFCISIFILFIPIEFLNSLIFISPFKISFLSLSFKSITLS